MVARTYMCKPTRFNNYLKGYRVFKVGVTGQTYTTMENYFKIRKYGDGTQLLYQKKYPNLLWTELASQVEKPMLTNLKLHFNLLPGYKEHFLVPKLRSREFKKMAKELM